LGAVQLAGCVGEINAVKDTIPHKDKDTIPHKDKDTIVPHKEIFCSRMLALLCGYASEGEFSAKDSKEENIKELVLTSEFIKAIFDGSETKKIFPKNFSALLPVKSCTSEVTSSIWEELLKQASLVSEDIHRSASPSNKNNPLQTIGSNVPTAVCDHVLPELLPLVLKRIERIANNVAFSEVLPKLGNRDVARRLVTQHLSDPYGSDAEFLVQSLLGVPKEKEAKENLKKQIPDVPLAFDKVVDYFVANFASGLDKLQKSGRNISEWQIAGIRKQIDFSIQGVHKELQQQAADKAQEVALRAQKKEFADLQKQTYAALDTLIQGALPEYLNNQQVKWPNLKLSEADRNKLLFFLSEERNSDTLHNDLLDLIVVSLVASPDFSRIIEGKNPVVQQNSTGKNITYCRATDEQKQLFVREFLQTIPADTLAAALENCAKLPETFTDYIHQREMSNLAQAIQERYTRTF
jgi:hypothetical protein